MGKLKLVDGYLTMNDQKDFIFSADYPYYRDNESNWDDRIQKIKAMGVNTLTFYIPFRHHLISEDGEMVFDFDGQTKGNRNVLHFIDLVAQHELNAIVKPGPFIHAEVNFGGLPDCINPLKNTSIEPMLDDEKKAIVYEDDYFLPAPLGDSFQKCVTLWLKSVYEVVIKKHINPNGPIIAVQCLNEGIYSNLDKAPYEYDYSKSSKALYSSFLKKKYKTIDIYNQLHGTSFNSYCAPVPPVRTTLISEIRDFLTLIDWAEYQAFYLDRIYNTYRVTDEDCISTIANVSSPPNKTCGLDVWLTRVKPQQWRNRHYGTTSWAGVISHDWGAFIRNLSAIKLQKGPNLETNWGFSSLYDKLYEYPVTSFFQTIFEIASGATGYNVYTGVTTANWDSAMGAIPFSGIILPYLLLGYFATS